MLLLFVSSIVIVTMVNTKIYLLGLNFIFWREAFIFFTELEIYSVRLCIL